MSACAWIPQLQQSQGKVTKDIMESSRTSTAQNGLWWFDKCRFRFGLCWFGHPNCDDLRLKLKIPSPRFELGDVWMRNCSSNVLSSDGVFSLAGMVRSKLPCLDSWPHQPWFWVLEESCVMFHCSLDLPSLAFSTLDQSCFSRRFFNEVGSASNTQSHTKDYHSITLDEQSKGRNGNIQIATQPFWTCTKGSTFGPSSWDSWGCVQQFKLPASITKLAVWCTCIYYT